jgi:hypothetical protein
MSGQAKPLLLMAFSYFRAVASFPRRWRKSCSVRINLGEAVSKKLSTWVFGGLAVLLALGIARVTWRHEGVLRVRAATLVDETRPPAQSRSVRYVGAYTIPLTAEGNPATSGANSVSEVLVSNTNSSAKALALAALYPQLPGDAQTVVAQHIVNLLPDSAYSSFAPHLTNANVLAEVRAVIYADLLQRPNSIKLPWLLAVARSPGVSQSGQAAALLQATLREDHGANWNVWSERIHTWLQANPEVSDLKVSN